MERVLTSSSFETNFHFTANLILVHIHPLIPHPLVLSIKLKSFLHHSTQT